MKTINVKPVEELEIRVTDELSYVCSFNMLSMMYMQEEVTKLNYDDYHDVPQGTMFVIMLYAGIKSNCDDFTLGMAREIAKSLSKDDYQIIMTMYKNSLSGQNEEKKTRKNSHAVK